MMTHFLFFMLFFFMLFFALLFIALFFALLFFALLFLALFLELLALLAMVVCVKGKKRSKAFFQSKLSVFLKKTFCP
jgi:hypothetical protein